MIQVLPNYGVVEPHDFPSIEAVGINDQAQRNEMLRTSMQHATDLFKEATKFRPGSPHYNMLMTKGEQFTQPFLGVHNATGLKKSWSGNPLNPTPQNADFNRALATDDMKSYATATPVPKGIPIPPSPEWAVRMYVLFQSDPKVIESQTAINQMEADIENHVNSGNYESADYIKNSDAYKKHKRIVDQWNGLSNYVNNLPFEQVKSVSNTLLGGE